MLKKLISTILCTLALTAVCANAETTIDGNRISFDEKAEYKIAAAYDADGSMKGVQMFSEEAAALDYASIAKDVDGAGTVKVFSWDKSLNPVADAVESSVVSLELAAFDEENRSYSDGEGDNDKESAAYCIANDYESLYYYDSADKTGKVTEYRISDDVTLYVNNVELDDWDEDVVYNYITNNAAGDIVIADSDNDGIYDNIYVSHYKSAVISDVMEDGTVYFDVAEWEEWSPFAIHIDLDEDKIEDGELTYSITLDGEKIDYLDLMPYDVVSIAYDVTDTFDDSSFYNILVNRTPVQGMITMDDTDTNTYMVNGVAYKYDAKSLPSGYSRDAVGMEAILYVDVFGRIVVLNESASSKKFAILESVWVSVAEDVYYATLVFPDGTSATYEVKDEDDADYLAMVVYESGDIYDRGEKNPIYDRVVTYKLNSSNLLHSVECVYYRYAEDEYIADTNKIGSVKLNSETKLLDASEYFGRVSDIFAMPLSALADESEYEVYAYGKLSDGTYSFVIVMSGVSDYTDNTQTAVFVKSYIGIDENGDSVDAVTLLYGGEEKDFNISDFSGNIGDLSELNKGDVVIFTTDYRDGSINRMDLVASMNLCDGTERIDYDKREAAEIFCPDAWNSDYEYYEYDTEVELYYGVIEKVGGDYIYMTSFDDADNSTVRYNITNSTGVYVYDYTKSASNALYWDLRDNIEQTVIPYSARNMDYSINWDKIDANTVNYAFVKAVAGNVTEIFVVNAPEDGVMDSVDTTSKAYTANYGIIDSVDTESNTVRIISSQGETKEFSVGRDLTADIVAEMVYDIETGEKNDIENRLCTYECSGSTITKFEISPVEYIFGEKYNAETDMLGRAKLSSSAAILDVSEIDGGKVSVVEKDYIRDDISYTAVACGWVEDGYKFVIIAGGIWEGYSDEDSVAIFVKSFVDVNDDGESADAITVLYEGEERNYFIDSIDTNLDELDKGDIIVFNIDFEGEIDELDVITKTGLCNGTTRVDYETSGYYFDLVYPAGWNWEYNEDTDVELDFGVIVDKTSIDFAITDYGTEWSAYDERWYDLDETNVYVYSYKEPAKSALFVGNKSNIVKTPVQSAAKDDDDNIQWDEINEYGVNYAFVKAVDGEATDVFVILGPGKEDY